MTALRFITLVALTLLAGCGFMSPSPTTVEIADAMKTNELTLLSTKPGYLPHTISLWLTGRIDGTAYMTFTERSEQLPLSGDVRWAVSYDFFRTSGVFGYYPVSVQTGHLTLQYLYR